MSVEGPFSIIAPLRGQVLFAGGDVQSRLPLRNNRHPRGTIATNEKHYVLPLDQSMIYSPNLLRPVAAAMVAACFPLAIPPHSHIALAATLVAR